MAVVIEDFEVISEPAPAPSPSAAPPAAQPGSDIDPFKLAEALARRAWSLQRVQAD